VKQFPDGNLLLFANGSRLKDPHPEETLMKLSLEGVVDRSFLANVQRLGLRITGFTLDSQGRIVLHGVRNGTNVIFRLNLNGSLDNSFTPTTVGLNTAVSRIDLLTVLPGDRLFLSGYFVVTDGNRMATNLALVEPDGTLSETFDTMGQPLPIISVAALEDMTIASTFDGFYKLNLDGSFVRIGSSLPYPSGASVVQRDGKVVIGGSGSAILRYNRDGSLDPTFTPIKLQQKSWGWPRLAWYFSPESVSLSLQKDDKILIAGSVNSEEGTRSWVIRYLPDGMLDATFEAGISGPAPLDLFSTVSLKALQLSDGRIAVWGNFAQFGNYLSPEITILGVPRRRENVEIHLTQSSATQTNRWKFSQSIDPDERHVLQHSTNLFHWNSVVHSSVNSSAPVQISIAPGRPGEFFRLTPETELPLRNIPWVSTITNGAKVPRLW
jgi:uncharacterized delta-60 repeat protein